MQRDEAAGAGVDCTGEGKITRRLHRSCISIWDPRRSCARKIHFCYKRPTLFPDNVTRPFLNDGLKGVGMELLRLASKVN